MEEIVEINKVSVSEPGDSGSAELLAELLKKVGQGDSSNKTFITLKSTSSQHSVVTRGVKTVTEVRRTRGADGNTEVEVLQRTATSSMESFQNGGEDKVVNYNLEMGEFMRKGLGNQIHETKTVTTKTVNSGDDDAISIEEIQDFDFDTTETEKLMSEKFTEMLHQSPLAADAEVNELFQKKVNTDSESHQVAKNPEKLEDFSASKDKKSKEFWETELFRDIVVFSVAFGFFVWITGYLFQS